MDQEIGALFIEWVKQTRKACEAQAEANQLVCKISETLMVNEVVMKTEEMSGDRQKWNS
jgi:hypothetical protein